MEVLFVLKRFCLLFSVFKFEYENCKTYINQSQATTAVNEEFIFRAIQTFQNVNNNECSLKGKKSSAHTYKKRSITLKHMMSVQYPLTDSLGSLLKQETMYRGFNPAGVEYSGT